MKKSLLSTFIFISCASEYLVAGFVAVRTNKLVANQHALKKHQNHLPYHLRMSASGISSSESQDKSTPNVPVMNLVSSTEEPLVQKQQDGENTATPSFPMVLWRFTRPHTIIGSALAIPSLHLLAATSWSAAFSPKMLMAASYALIPSLLMNLYVTGLNQITDVEIDKINKPDLPIAAGHLSMRNAIVTVVLSLIMSLWLGVAHPIWGTTGLQTVLAGSALLGTLYSMPPFRFKRFPFLAATCIVAVRGSLINAAFYAHATAAGMGMKTSVLSCLMNHPKCAVSSLFFGIFGVVIALMKDVPDVLGDKTLNIRTFSVRIGQRRVFQAMRRLLSGTFFAMGLAFLRRAWMGVTAATTTGISGGRYVTAGRLITAIASMLFARSVERQAGSVDPQNSKEVYTFYMHLWKLFYLSYLILPFAR